MPKAKNDRRINLLEPSFEQVLVCNKKEFRAFLEIFFQEPENISQQNLGVLFGILEISDHSEDSSYIVNYLVSVLKKEYFSKPKRGPIESFEAALHKANLALSKLAEHENINWIGKFNSIIAVLEKNNLHLTQTGTTSAFLLRNKTLTDISEGLSPDSSNPNPLKTFVNVSSGRIEKEDKIIIATDAIFDVFSFEEIKKSSIRFSKEQFIRFLKTALGNELEKAAALVIDILEKKKPAAVEFAPVPEKSKTINAFSMAAFSGKRRNAPEISNKEIQEEMTKTETQKKSGHIYIKESEIINQAVGSQSFSQNLIENFDSKKAVVSDFLSKAKSKLDFNVPEIKNPLRKFRKNGPEKRIEMNRFESGKNAPAQVLKIKNWLTKTRPVLYATIRQIKNVSAIFLGRIKKRKKRNWPKPVKLPSPWPNFSKISKIIASFDYRQKIYALLFIIFLFVVPALFLKFQRFSEEKSKPAEMISETVTIPLEQDKNLERIGNINSINQEGDVLDLIQLGEKLFLIEKSSVLDLEKNEKYDLPEELGEISLASGMEDLNLLFLINKENKIMSFSPISRKFQPNNIQVAENAKISGMGTYLTYLYLLDSNNGKIHRYPRAEGGFGAGTDWLKDSVDLSKTNNMSLNDNIFTADSGKILKFFKGRQQEFSIEQSATPIEIDRIHTPKENEIYALDRKNSRFVKLDMSGNIIKQYYNPEFSGADSFAASGNTIYFSTSEGVRSFDIQ